MERMLRRSAVCMNVSRREDKPWRDCSFDCGACQVGRTDSFMALIISVAGAAAAINSLRQFL